MPRPSKGARLVWRDEYRKKDGSLMHRAGWYIEDGGRRYSTGCGRADVAEAEKQLGVHIAQKHAPARQRNRDPDQVKISDVINVYGAEVAVHHARPAETAARLTAILKFFGRLTLSDINGKLCRDYAGQAASPAAARRQLEDLRAALKHYYEEGFVTSIPAIVLPEKAAGRQRWLTRSEAARLILAAWRMRQTWKGVASDRRTGQHVARFILVALYTGTRSGAVCNAAIRLTEGQGHVDLDRGVFYRRADGVRETKKRQPPVRLPDRLLSHIRRWATTPVQIKTKARGKSLTIGRMIAHDFVVEWQGQPVGSLRKAFASACEAAGLGWYDEAGDFQTDVTPHALRHTAATWLMQNGEDLSLAADYLGMTEAVLRQTYYHHHPDFQAGTAERITAKGPALKVKSNVVRMR
ncbi:site-specific integrase [Mesorhizobium sp. C120A]|uniref:site-specific integrase n=1 Tax=unclassified Mesorhizobium TaxID=325217 RepID=UPI0003CFED46|nr:MULTISPECIES: site-specific integrase [unclassified Mesorhizobium]ESZ60128.1 integrase [Mesorhizobium sp. L103C120A0]WJI44011.1 site-specific integrase [Mesorhizobium sp. C120A]